MQKLLSFMRQNPHDPILIGNYSANMSVGYFSAITLSEGMDIARGKNFSTASLGK